MSFRRVHGLTRVGTKSHDCRAELDIDRAIIGARYAASDLCSEGLWADGRQIAYTSDDRRKNSRRTRQNVFSKKKSEHDTSFQPRIFAAIGQAARRGQRSLC